jgi:hypothetical protein
LILYRLSVRSSWGRLSIDYLLAWGRRLIGSWRSLIWAWGRLCVDDLLWRCRGVHNLCFCGLSRLLDDDNGWAGTKQSKRFG